MLLKTHSTDPLSISPVNEKIPMCSQYFEHYAHIVMKTYLQHLSVRRFRRTIAKVTVKNYLGTVKKQATFI